MPKKRRKFRRPSGQRRYRKLFVIATKGRKTEPRYFSLFNSASVIRVLCLKCDGDSAPKQVLKRMQHYLKDEGIKSTDEAWLVVDKDQWSSAQLLMLHQWAQSALNYGMALSNPKFEYWLLLHFEEGRGVGTSSQCSERLRRYLPGYDKDVSPRKFPTENIIKAVQRAQARDKPPCKDWPRRPGQTTVYRLVARLLAQSAP